MIAQGILRVVSFFLVLVVVIVSVGCGLLAAFGLLGTSRKKTNDVHKYEASVGEVIEADEHMPELSALGDYTSLTVTRKDVNLVFFCISTVALIVQYDEADFAAEVARIREAYPAAQAFSGVRDHKASYRSYEISAIEGSSAALLLIGINEKTHSVAYMIHHDLDLDLIDDLDEFVRQYYYLPR